MTRREARWVKGRNFEREDRELIIDMNGTIDNWEKYCTNCLIKTPVINGASTETDICPCCGAEMRGGDIK